jgi:hypothetical protein
MAADTAQLSCVQEAVATAIPLREPDPGGRSAANGRSGPVSFLANPNSNRNRKSAKRISNLSFARPNTSAQTIFASRIAVAIESKIDSISRETKCVKIAGNGRSSDGMIAVNP